MTTKRHSEVLVRFSCTASVTLIFVVGKSLWILWSLFCCEKKVPKIYNEKRLDYSLERFIWNNYILSQASWHWKATTNIKIVVLLIGLHKGNHRPNWKRPIIIKLIKRSTFGFRNFENFKKQILSLWTSKKRGLKLRPFSSCISSTLTVDKEANKKRYTYVSL